MSGSTSMNSTLGQIAGLSTVSGVSGRVLAETGSPLGYFLLVGFSILIVLVILTRVVKTIN